GSVTCPPYRRPAAGPERRKPQIGFAGPVTGRRHHTVAAGIQHRRGKTGDHAVFPEGLNFRQSRKTPLARFLHCAEDYSGLMNREVSMRFQALFAAAAISTLFALPAGAADTAQQGAMKSCAATWKTMSAADKGKTKYTDYMGTCM